jgi:hypothetical protein
MLHDDRIAEIERLNRLILKSLLIEMGVQEFSAPGSKTRELQDIATSLQANITRQALNGKRVLVGHEQLVLPAVELRQPPKQLEGPAKAPGVSIKDDPHSTTEWRDEILAWTLGHAGMLSLPEYHAHYIKVFGDAAKISRTRFGAVYSWMMRSTQLLEQAGQQQYRLTTKGREFAAANGITATSGFTPKEATPPPEPSPQPAEEVLGVRRTDLRHRMISHAKAHGGKFQITTWAASEKAHGRYAGVGGGAYKYLRDKKLFKQAGNGEYILVA